MARVNCRKLREKKRDDLLKELEDYKKELATLRVTKVTGGAPNKVAQMYSSVMYMRMYDCVCYNRREVRKSIAKVLTVINQNQAANLRKFYHSKKYKPTDLRKKQTRAMRKALTKRQKSLVTRRELVRKAHFPMRKFAIDTQN